MCRLRDLDLVVLQIPRQLDDLHAVLQRKRDRIPDVRGGDEHHARQVVVHIQIVVVERHVLFRVEHFQQRRRRIAAEVHAHLVHFIQQHQRVHHAGAAHGLDDLARHGADVRPPVPADLRLIAHAAERDAHERTSQGTGDGLRQRGLPDAGRPDEAEDLPLHLTHEVQDGDMLEDALLGLLQTEMVFIQDRLHVIDLQIVRVRLCHGTLTIHSRYPRMTVDSGDIGGVFFSLLNSSSAFSSTALRHLRLADVLPQLRQLG